jgi:putative cell wall-binding protein
VPTRPTVRTVAAFAALTVAVLFAGVASCYAAAPPTSAIAITPAQGFETAVASPWAVMPFDVAGQPANVAYWGPVTGKAHSGSRSLWVAGTLANGTANPLAATYPSPCSGTASLTLDLSQYYSASMAFSYALAQYPGTSTPFPDMGGNDTFLFGWWANGAAVGHTVTNLPQTGTGWSTKTYSLTDAAGDVNLSRKAGNAEFRFIDQDEGGYLYPPSGRGPFLDDVSVTGFKYGPVRSLAAVRSSGLVHLTWAAPYTAVGSSVADTRTIGYRVWRTPNTVPYAWSEITSSTARPTGASFDDTRAAVGVQYRYVVQAWDPGTGSGYGEVKPDTTGGAGGAIVVNKFADPDVQRIAGINRFATAVMCSQRAFPVASSVTTLVVSSGFVWTDTLSAVPLAGASGGPLLLVGPSTPIDSSVPAEIQRLGAKTVYISGNMTSINTAVRSAIRALPGVSVVDIGGTDVPSVNELVAKKVAAERGGTKGGTVFIARSDGANFADALAASSVAAALHAPIILVPNTGSTLPAATIRALQAVRADEAVVLGQPNAVPDAIVTQVMNNCAPGATSTRKGGANRYETARLIVEWGQAKLGARVSLDTAYVATGMAFPDALGGGPLAGASADGKWRPLLTTSPTALSPAVITFLDANPAIKKVRVLGGDYNPTTGKGAVDDTVLPVIGMHLY